MGFTAEIRGLADEVTIGILDLEKYLTAVQTEAKKEDINSIDGQLVRDLLHASR
jgi:hypothetical protein